MADKKYVVAIDQGTTSSRAIVFDHSGRIVSVGQKEHEQIFPRAGWVEHDANEIWTRCREVVGLALAKENIPVAEIAAVGVTNQRETTVVWDKNTGEPVYNAIVWQDTRGTKRCDELSADGGQDRFRALTGLPISVYPSATKVEWILKNVEGAQARADAGDLLFGNIDTWVIWNLTGGPNGGAHVTDVSNASRTMLMNIETLEWDPGMLEIFNIPASMLPAIKSSSEVYGYASDDSALAGVPVSGDLGDQQAATFGQACFSVGMAKNTYGTGCFMLMNTGNEAVPSKNGLITTVCYKIGDQPTVYALEGSIAVTGSLVQWLRDNLKMFESSSEIEALALTVEDNGGAYFVPAFSGLFAPYWRSDARGAIVGLTRYVNRGHLARAVLESTAYQTKDVLVAMEADSGAKLAELKVDGGMTANETLMQFQSDLLGTTVIRPVVAETTALGAAYAAGIAVGFWDGEQDVIDNWAEDKRWTPAGDQAEMDRLYRNWKKAVTKTYDWVDADVVE